ncbi:hypothetical protein EZV62_003655 [Acer yangbiense]|uniref:Serine-threonine/tyrosine-protein kinase catalytic domain-containing protein n=1 Tax=Acer yangbiense TaxID=1000413 RepID=A0A5C7IHF1_9ROSI|nr:hypothetical protein EZV62_003655 [Acer yangbiense]
MMKKLAVVLFLLVAFSIQVQGLDIAKGKSEDIYGDVKAFHLCIALRSSSSRFCSLPGSISCDGNPNLRCHEKKKNKFIVPLVASAAAILFTLLIALAISLRLKRRKEQGTKFQKLRRYYVTNRLNEKSDVYSFGIVLLEIITSHPVVKIGEDENVHITQWVINMLGNGDITNIVDPSLEGDFETNSAWKAVELALACASHVSSKRPTMNDVVMELKDCLAMETARKMNCHGSEVNSAHEIFTMNNMDSECSTPRAR